MTTKQYNFIYQHNNGAMVYKAGDGEKYIKFDDLIFKSIGEVNEYIKINRTRLNQEEARERDIKNDPQYLSNDDWLKLKGE